MADGLTGEPGSRPAAADVAPVLLFDGDDPRIVTAARLWWQLVSRDRYELRPLAQVDTTELGVPAADDRADRVVWVSPGGRTRTGAAALGAAARAAAPRWTIPVRVALRTGRRAVRAAIGRAGVRRPAR